LVIGFLHRLCERSANAWSYLDGAAYRNADFMKSYDDRGTLLRVEGAGTMTVDLKVLD
jgi:hypothetical protein